MFFAMTEAIQAAADTITESITESAAQVTRTFHRYFWDDLGELKPIPRGIRRCRHPLTKAQKIRRRIAREKYKKRLSFLFGPQVRRKKKSRVIFALFPDIEDHPKSAAIVDRLLDPDEREEIRDIMDAEQSTLAPDIIELGQLIIKERAAMVRECWSPNKLRKANHFHVKPLVFQPLDDNGLHLESRDFSE